MATRWGHWNTTAAAAAHLYQGGDGGIEAVLLRGRSRVEDLEDVLRIRVQEAVDLSLPP